MDWLAPVLGTMISEADKALRGRIKCAEDPPSKEVSNTSLLEFYDEMEAVENRLPKGSLEEFRSSARVLEDFLCVCDYEGGIKVQNLLTLAMSAYSSNESEDGSIRKTTSPHLIRQTKRMIDGAVDNAAKSEAQRAYVRPACDVFMQIIIDGSELENPVKLTGDCNG